MNKIEIKIKISQHCEDEGIKEYESTVRSNYTPSDSDSILNCIRDLNDKTKGFEEDIESLNRLYENGITSGFASSASVTAVRIRFIRPDDTIIDETWFDDLEEIGPAIDFMSKFYLS